MATTLDTKNNHLTIEKAKAALTSVLAALAAPENQARLEEARAAAGNDMTKMMQIVFPLVTQIQMEVIQNYGFTADGEGAILFSQAVRTLEKEDSDISQLNAQVRAFFIPPMVPQPPPHLPTSSAS